MENKTSWFVSRDYSLAVWDEYIPCQSWSGERRLSDTLIYKIDIHGKYKANNYGLVAYRWSSTLSYNGLSFPVFSTHPSCKSVVDACKQADKALTCEIFDRACHFFLSRKFAHCIVNKDMQPFFTSFGPPKWVNSYLSYSKQNYPSGQYYHAYWFKGEVQFSRTDISTYGYSGGGTDVRFEHWLGALDAEVI